ncbi:MAG: F0F1 ATP synthase subunit epsilon [Pantoea sp. Brub]|nr:F0F1 ATP synthase subunit epsilon [Pantoea sp. Brub]
MIKTYQLDIVSIEKQLYSDLVQQIRISGSEGELGILAGHSPLLTTINPGVIYITKNELIKEFIYISGGILEVQPNNVVILADVAIRGKDLDQNRALKSKIEAEKNINNQHNNFNNAIPYFELSKAIAKLRAIELTKNHSLN